MSTWLAVYLILAGTWLLVFAWAALGASQLLGRDDARKLARIALAAPGWPFAVLYGAVLFVRFAFGKDATR